MQLTNSPLLRPRPHLRPESPTVQNSSQSLRSSRQGLDPFFLHHLPNPFLILQLFGPFCSQCVACSGAGLGAPLLDEIPPVVDAEVGQEPALVVGEAIVDGDYSAGYVGTVDEMEGWDWVSN